MFKSLFRILPFLLVMFSCKGPRNTSKTISNLPSPDSLRTSDLLFLSPEKQFLYYQNIEHILPVNQIKAGNAKYPLKEAFRDLSDFSFSFKDTIRTLNDFINDTRVVGLIALKNDTILFEKYNTIQPGSKWINFSVAKSITSLLYGVALQDGYIKSLDEKVTQYITELKGSEYDSVSLFNLLQMASGVAWNDDPRDRESDLIKVGRMEREAGWSGVAKYLSQLKRAAPPGAKFNYNTIETNLAAVVLYRAINRSLSDYLSEKIWKPFGMSSDANWITSRSLKVELGGCCISASLRDYALLGAFAMRNGIDLANHQILKPGWMKEATTSSRGNPGYGYYWWLRRDGRFFASGSFGQQIEIDPAEKIVIAVQSYWPIAYNNYYVDYLDAMIEAMINRFKK